jgi:hypothetical protein
MSTTRKQKEKERFAKLIESYVGPNQSSDKMRADNRKTEKRKREQFRRVG